MIFLKLFLLDPAPGRYIQKLSQEQSIANGSAFNSFLNKAQSEVQQWCEEVELDVYLVNGKKVTLNCLSTDQTEDVLEVF